VTCRIAVLASGAGSNLQALLARFGSPTNPGAREGVIAWVGSDRESAGALAIARRYGVTAAVLRDPNDAMAMLELLEDARIDLLVLAGYLKRVPDGVTHALRGRVLNVHPALLPAFGGRGMYGVRLHQAVIDAGMRVTGVTVHFVDEEYDHGPIIAQWPVPVLAGDTATTLAARVLVVEHQLYPCAVSAVAAGRVTIDPAQRAHGQVLARTPGHTYALVSEEGHPICAG
jgi:phosphoribosylglycinamide formyltransferase-1